MMCGGTAEVKPADEEVKIICDQLREAMEEKAGKKFGEYIALSYKTQVVAGTNFFVKIKVDAEEHIHARIFKPLPHTKCDPELQSIQCNKKLDDDIEYF